jgi:hypothetical protein
MKLIEQDSKKALKRYCLSVCAATVLSVLLRCLCLAFFFDRELGYYQAGAILPVIATVLPVIAVVLFAVLAVKEFRRVPLTIREPQGKSVRLAATTAAILPIVFAAIQVIGGNKEDLIARMLLLLSILVAAYFLIQGGTSEITALPRFITGLGMILWLLMALALSYFDITVQMNAPDKLIFQLACLGGMLFTVSELRIAVGSLRSVRYLFFMGISILFAGTSALPSLILGALNVIDRPSWFWCYLVIFGMLIYTVARMLSLTVKAEPAEEGTTEQDATEETVTEKNESESSTPEE